MADEGIGRDWAGIDMLILITRGRQELYTGTTMDVKKVFSWVIIARYFIPLRRGYLEEALQNTV